MNTQQKGNGRAQYVPGVRSGALKELAYPVPCMQHFVYNDKAILFTIPKTCLTSLFLN